MPKARGGREAQMRGANARRKCEAQEKRRDIENVARSDATRPKGNARVKEKARRKLKPQKFFLNKLPRVIVQLQIK